MNPSPLSRKVIDAIKAHVELEASIVGACSMEQQAKEGVRQALGLCALMLNCNLEDVYFSPASRLGLLAILKALRLKSNQCIYQYGFTDFPSRSSNTEVVEIPSFSD